MPGVEVSESELRERLTAIVRATPPLMQVLSVARRLCLPDWLVFSGAVYQPVLNHLTHRPLDYGIKDYDLGYFDGSDLSYEAEDAIIRRVEAAFDEPLRSMVEVRNQARVHDYYTIAAAADLPFENCSFDLAVAYNVLMDVEDVPGALREIRRVLRPSGTLVISIVHPFADRGHFAGPEADAPFVLQKSYFGRERFEGTEVRNELKMHFAGWSQPLESYMAALENAGLAITSLREPVPDTADIGSHMARWKKVPLFLWAKALPLPI